MTLTKKITLVLGLFAAAGASFAQTAPTVSTPVGVLGQNYTEIGFGLQDIERSSLNLYSAGLAANVPVTSYLDLGAGYSYGWVRGGARGHSNTLAASATAYTLWNGAKPFVGLAAGYQWSRFAGFRDESGLWGAAVGVEIPVGALAITPRIVYADDFEGSVNSSQQTTYEVEANYWLSNRSAVYGSVGKVNVHGSSIDAWSYELGLRVKF